MIRNPQILSDYTDIRLLDQKTVGRWNRYTVETFLAVNKQDQGEYVIKRYAQDTADMRDAAVTAYNTRSALYFDVVEVGDLPDCQPGIVCYETAISDPNEKAFYLITGKVSGVDLADLIEEMKQCQISASTMDLLQLMRALADMLDTLHAQDIAHRNLSPGNIRVDLEKGQTWILDLDFSCFAKDLIIGPDQQNMFIPAICQDTGYGNVWWYPDPEVEMWEYEATTPFRSFSKELLLKSDVFAMGNIFYTLATGLRLFPGAGQSYRTSLRKGRKFIAELSPDPILNRMLGDLINDMTNLSPSGRPSISEVRDRLDAIINNIYDEGRMDVDQPDCLRIQCDCLTY